MRLSNADRSCFRDLMEKNPLSPRVQRIKSGSSVCLGGCQQEESMVHAYISLSKRALLKDGSQFL
ncbi:unnamed protein product [Citrullus colocynthis]|uniref:Uncharacterized protein n=1 Tax=Citrullus colocynthis TaxID=252529 RepID=A0ABP0Y159_9ROSI